MILAPVTNVLSCFILVLVLILIWKLSKKVRVGKSSVATKNRIDLLVTVSHIVITLAYTIT